MPTENTTAKVGHWSQAEMEQRLVRYRDLRACRNAFVDTYTPGSDKKENFTIIGPGVAEHPDQYVHIQEPHGFNIGGARQPPGCLNSQHSHETEEVFIVHEGQWAFRWGDRAQHGEVVLGPGDCISIPVNVFRGFENVGEDVGYLFAVLGGDDPGHVTWSPDVFEKASDYGLVLLENGHLVDTTRGERIPEGLEPQQPTSADQVAAHRVMSVEEMLHCVARADDQRTGQESALTREQQGAVESPVIGGANNAESIGAGTLAWDHGFHVRRLDFDAGAVISDHSRDEVEVIYVYSGHLRVAWVAGALELERGDVLTVPGGLMHSFHNSGDGNAVAYIVRGGNNPATPVFS